MANIRPLRESERQKAYETAKKWTAGKEPKLDNKQVVLTKYHPYVVSIVLILCIVLLVAAFVPSALRIHEAGKSEFCNTEGTFTEDVCNTVGWTAVLLAETGSLVFILALSVVESTTRINMGSYSIDPVQVLLWSSAFVSVLVAIVGNAHIGQPWKHGQLFDYLIVFVPPTLVLTVGYILKDFLLELLRSRRERNKVYLERKFMYEAVLENPETHEKWLSFYSKAIKEALQSANRNRIDQLETLSRDDWMELVLHEMKESNWTVNPERLQEINQPETVKDNWELESLIADGYIWQNENGTYSAIMPGTEITIGTEYIRPTSALAAMRIRKYHQDKKEG